MQFNIPAAVASFSALMAGQLQGQQQAAQDAAEQEQRQNQQRLGLFQSLESRDRQQQQDELEAIGHLAGPDQSEALARHYQKWSGPSHNLNVLPADLRKLIPPPAPGGSPFPASESSAGAGRLGQPLPPAAQLQNQAGVLAPQGPHPAHFGLGNALASLTGQAAPPLTAPAIAGPPPGSNPSGQPGPQTGSAPPPAPNGSMLAQLAAYRERYANYGGEPGLPPAPQSAPPAPAAPPVPPLQTPGPGLLSAPVQVGAAAVPTSPQTRPAPPAPPGLTIGGKTFPFAQTTPEQLRVALTDAREQAREAITFINNSDFKPGTPEFQKVQDLARRLSVIPKTAGDVEQIQAALNELAPLRPSGSIAAQRAREIADAAAERERDRQATIDERKRQDDLARQGRDLENRQRAADRRTSQIDTLIGRTPDSAGAYQIWARQYRVLTGEAPPPWSAFKSGDAESQAKQRLQDLRIQALEVGNQLKEQQKTLNEQKIQAGPKGPAPLSPEAQTKDLYRKWQDAEKKAKTVGFAPGFLKTQLADPKLDPRARALFQGHLDTLNAAQAAKEQYMTAYRQAVEKRQGKGAPAGPPAAPAKPDLSGASNDDIKARARALAEQLHPAGG